MSPTLARMTPLWLAVASAALLTGAFAFQYLGGLAPCVLCLWQRWPHAAVVVLAGAALLVGPPGARAALTALAGVALLAGAGIAGFHVGVEQHWWSGTAACGGGPQPETLEALRAQLMAQPVVRCDAVPWSLFGLSMAAYNLIASLALGLAGLWAAAVIWREDAHG